MYNVWVKTEQWGTIGHQSDKMTKCRKIFSVLVVPGMNFSAQVKQNNLVNYIACVCGGGGARGGGALYNL